MNKKTLPLAPMDMVAFFKDKTQVCYVDYDASLENLKSPLFIATYAANLGLMCNLDKITPEFMVSYMTSTSTSCTILNAQRVHANILYYAKCQEILYTDVLDLFTEQQICEFIKANVDMIWLQVKFVNSIELYITTCGDRDDSEGAVDESLATKYHTPVDEQLHPEIGFTVLKLFGLEEFLMIWNEHYVPLNEQTYFKRYFEEYMFDGNNMFSKVAVPGNLYFGLAVFIADAHGNYRSSVELMNTWIEMSRIVDGTEVADKMKEQALTQLSNRTTAYFKKRSKHAKKLLKGK